MKVQFWLLLLLATLGVYLLATRSPVTQSHSDPELTLLVAQALWQHGTIRLDAYQDRLALSRDFAAYIASDNIVNVRGHYYNYFPVGPSFLTVLVVAAANVLGYDMTRYADNDAVQNQLSGLTVALVFLLLFLLARCYLDVPVSLLLALLFTLGTGFMSTLATAFWTHNVTVPLYLLIFWLLARRATGQSQTIYPMLVGFLLFLATICRASAAAFILPLLLYLTLTPLRHAWSHRHQPRLALRHLVFPNGRLADWLWVVLTMGVCLALFFIWSRLEYGQWLSAYYTLNRFSRERTRALTALAGLLLSPGRGLFVYVAFLWPVMVLAVVAGRRLTHYPLLWFGGAWFGLHLLLVVRAASWWGGASFGPRLLVDVLPAWFLLTVLVGREAGVGLRPRTRITCLALTLPLVAWSIYLNSYQGLFNRYLGQWETELPPGRPVAGMFDWSYPPFAAAPELFCARDAAQVEQWLTGNRQVLSSYPLGLRLGAEQGFAGDRVGVINEARGGGDAAAYQLYLPLLTAPFPFLISGWTPTTAGVRWSKCPQAHIYLWLGPTDLTQTYRFTVHGATLGRQRITLLVNQQPLNQIVWDAPLVQPQEQSWLISGTLLQPNQLNQFTFTLPDATAANELDPRHLALAFFSLHLDVTTPPLPAYP